MRLHVEHAVTEYQLNLCDWSREDEDEVNISTYLVFSASKNVWNMFFMRVRPLIKGFSDGSLKKLNWYFWGQKLTLLVPSE